MTLQDAIQQNEPFTTKKMLKSDGGNHERFLMFIDNKIMFFDDDGDCDDWLRKYNLNYLKELGYKNTDSKSNIMLDKLVENEQIRKAEVLSLQARIKDKEIELKKAKKNEKNIFKNMSKNEMEYYERCLK